MRTNISKENYDAVRKFSTYPNNNTFDSSLGQLLKQMRKQGLIN